MVIFIRVLVHARWRIQILNVEITTFLCDIRFRVEFPRAKIPRSRPARHRCGTVENAHDFAACITVNAINVANLFVKIKIYSISYEYNERTHVLRPRAKRRVFWGSFPWRVVKPHRTCGG